MRLVRARLVLLIVVGASSLFAAACGESAAPTGASPVGGTSLESGAATLETRNGEGANTELVCHAVGNGSVNPLYVAPSAVPAHLGHGDDPPSTFYADTDGDGYGDAATSTLACAAPPGYVADNTDCDDTDAGVNPGATEIQGNGIDDDCDPSTPDVVTSACPCAPLFTAAVDSWETTKGAPLDGTFSPSAQGSFCNESPNFLIRTLGFQCVAVVDPGLPLTRQDLSTLDEVVACNQLVQAICES